MDTEGGINLDIDQIGEFVKENWIKLRNAKPLYFEDHIKSNWAPIRGKLEFIGVYAIYSEGRPIYVGSAGKGEHVLKYRIGDLFKKSKGRFYHTLTKKLAKEMTTLSAVREFYLHQCSFRVVETDDVDKARFLEQAFILLLKLQGRKPKYNS